MTNTNLKVGMLILMEHDIEKAVEFYKSLDLPLKFHLKEKWAEFLIGDVKLGLCPTETKPFKRHTGIVLEVEDLYKTYEELKAKDVKFSIEPKESAHGIMVGFEDPSGNIIDLYQPTPEKVVEMAKQAANQDKSSSCCSSKDSSKSSSCCKDSDDKNLDKACSDNNSCCSK